MTSMQGALQEAAGPVLMRVVRIHQPQLPPVNPQKKKEEKKKKKKRPILPAPVVELPKLRF